MIITVRFLKPCESIYIFWVAELDNAVMREFGYFYKDNKGRKESVFPRLQLAVARVTNLSEKQTQRSPPAA